MATRKLCFLLIPLAVCQLAVTSGVVAAGCGAVFGDAVDQTAAASSEDWSCPKSAAVDAGVREDGIGCGMSGDGQVGLAGGDEPGDTVGR